VCFLSSFGAKFEFIMEIVERHTRAAPDGRTSRGHAPDRRASA